jgi:PPM family protein phosphatase
MTMRSEAAGRTDVGLQREHNEDSFVVVAEHQLYIVADGMGGHRAGDVASKVASETIAEFFRRSAREDVTWPFHFDARLSDEENRLQTALRVANRQVYERSVRSKELRGMGTTVVGALFNSERGVMYVAHVGDSRAYRIRGGVIKQLTRDHSLVNDYLAAMPDMPDDQRNDLPKNVITRALGMQDTVDVDIVADDAEPGDVYLLCSDGLSGMVADDELCDVAGQNLPLGEACDRLVTMANEHGGEDNVTAVLIRVEGERPPRAIEPTLAKTQRLQAITKSDLPAAGLGAVDELSNTPPAGFRISQDAIVTEPPPPTKPDEEDG